ncbi:hypothetical protein A9P82_08500 [Arachidicoccus ginsenosidimutans]|uniref:hypothetical protein n=1 Tax=Arachidicoccus sp. BS20 TaxID=1850526 RepID=UPI0007F0853C|nr:hypothetical protein [Arachidicoccus sp. BS20]ANI89315.1 hypothetical protein A9P82_08430 [Arachidicoccus sp. BS20]ANI89328.1 hypothetical protein A9P82_08500 [Arachidicoccus sp. BS20]
MEAMNYEYLLRMIYGCGRNNDNGANADIYRRLEQAEWHRNDPLWGKSQKEKENDYRNAFMKVRRYVEDAMLVGIREIQNAAATEEDVQQLKTLRTELVNMQRLNKNRLDEIIDEATKIFRKNNLIVR